MDLQLLHRAASAYYLDELRQAEVAEKLGVSRPTVSKLLAEARRIGLVRFEVLDIEDVDRADLEHRLRGELGLASVRIAPGDQVQRDYRDLRPLLTEELRALRLQRGDVLLISSGRTLHAISGMHSLPELPGVLVVPTVGGQQESASEFQTNEIVRRFAVRAGADPRFIFAPALPSPSLWESLQSDPSFTAIIDLWSRADAALVSIGAPYNRRASLTSVVPREDPSLRVSAGDVSLHFFDADGAMLDFPGSNLLVRAPLEVLRKVPTSIAIGLGSDKAPSIRAAAQAGLFTNLITDVAAAEAILGSVDT